MYNITGAMFSLHLMEPGRYHKTVRMCPFD